MTRIEKFRFSAITYITAALVAFGYELRSFLPFLESIPAILLAFISTILGAEFIAFIIDFILRLQWVRKKISGDLFIEGYWLIKTENDSDKYPLPDLGLLYIKYKIDQGAMKAVCTRFDEKGNRFTTQSSIVSLQEESSNVKYLNYFTADLPHGKRNGIAYAEFFRDQEGEIPNRYSGYICFADEGENRWQKAEKIHEDIVSKFFNFYGDEWLFHFLKKHSESKHILPTVENQN